MSNCLLNERITVYRNRVSCGKGTATMQNVIHARTLLHRHKYAQNNLIHSGKEDTLKVYFFSMAISG